MKLVIVRRIEFMCDYRKGFSENSSPILSVALDGATALDLISNFDVIVLDVMLRCNGIEICRRLRTCQKILFVHFNCIVVQKM
jgi:DNA-binding response OmpR family regulator